MIRAILYAKRLILPSTQAHVIQSLQMAAAFSATGLPCFFFPGVRRAETRHFPAVSGAGPQGLLGGEKPLSLAQALARELAAAGIAPVPRQWRALGGNQNGWYSLRFRLHAAAVMAAKSGALLYARDVSEAAFLAFLRKAPVFGRADGRFVFEMHEALYLQHRDIEGRADWQKTLARERRILAGAHGLVVTNRDIADLALGDLGYTGPVLEEPNGVNEALFRPLDLFSDKAPWPGESDEVRLVYIGNMQPGKGVPELVRAVALLPGRFRLTIIGAGRAAALAEIRELIDSLPEGPERIRLTGHVPQADMYGLCRGAHMSIIPQQAGGGYFSPLKLNESLALGLPTVCTPLPVFARHKDITHQSPDCTPQGLAAAIRELASLPGRARELREKGLEAASWRTWKARAARILDFANGL